MKAKQTLGYVALALGVFTAAPGLVQMLSKHASAQTAPREWTAGTSTNPALGERARWGGLVNDGGVGRVQFFYRSEGSLGPGAGTAAAGAAVGAAAGLVPSAPVKIGGAVAAGTLIGQGASQGLYLPATDPKLIENRPIVGTSGGMTGPVTGALAPLQQQTRYNGPSIMSPCINVACPGGGGITGRGSMKMAGD